MISPSSSGASASCTRNFPVLVAERYAELGDEYEIQALLHLWIVHPHPTKLKYHFAHDATPPIISWP